LFVYKLLNEKFSNAPKMLKDFITSYGPRDDDFALKLNNFLNAKLHEVFSAQEAGVTLGGDLVPERDLISERNAVQPVKPNLVPARDLISERNIVHTSPMLIVILVLFILFFMAAGKCNKKLKDFSVKIPKCQIVK
jgi:hypothetical protein